MEKINANSITLKIHDDRELATAKFHVSEVIGNRILLERGKLLIVGEPKARKSFLLDQTAFELAYGRQWLNSGYIPQPRRVLIFALEEWAESFAEREQKLLAGLKLTKALDGAVKMVESPPLPLTDTSVQSAIIQTIERTKPDVVCFDPFYMINDKDENSATEVAKTFHVLDSWQRAYGFTSIVVHHTKKAQFDNYGAPIDMGFGSVRGSIQFIAWPENILLVDVKGKEPNQSFKMYGKNRRGRSLPETVLTFDDSTMVATLHAEEAGQTDATLRVSDVLKSHRRLMLASEIQTLTGLSNGAVHNALNLLESQKRASNEVDSKDKRIRRWKGVS